MLYCWGRYKDKNLFYILYITGVIGEKKLFVDFVTILKSQVFILIILIKISYKISFVSYTR